MTGRFWSVQQKANHGGHCAGESFQRDARENTQGTTPPTTSPAISTPSHMTIHRICTASAGLPAVASTFSVTAGGVQRFAPPMGRTVTVMACGSPGELKALYRRTLTSEDVGLHDRLAFFQIHGCNRYLCHTQKHRLIFAEPQGKLEQVPHSNRHGDGVEFECPAIITLDDLALWRSMRRVLSMPGMCRNHT